MNMTLSTTLSLFFMPWLPELISDGNLISSGLGGWKNSKIDTCPLHLLETKEYQSDCSVAFPRI